MADWWCLLVNRLWKHAYTHARARAQATNNRRSYDTVSAAAFEDVERKNASLKSEITSLTLVRSCLGGGTRCHAFG